jgi:hypothetical protein
VICPFTASEPMAAIQMAGLEGPICAAGHLVKVGMTSGQKQMQERLRQAELQSKTLCTEEKVAIQRRRAAAAEHRAASMAAVAKVPEFVDFVTRRRRSSAVKVKPEAPAMEAMSVEGCVAAPAATPVERSLEPPARAVGAFAQRQRKRSRITFSSMADALGDISAEDSDDACEVPSFTPQPSPSGENRKRSLVCRRDSLMDVSAEAMLARAAKTASPLRSRDSLCLPSRESAATDPGPSTTFMKTAEVSFDADLALMPPPPCRMPGRKQLARKPPTRGVRRGRH